MADALVDGRHARRHHPPDADAGIDVAPSDIDLSATENELFTAIGREQVLREALEGQVADATTTSSSTARRTSAC